MFQQKADEIPMSTRMYSINTFCTRSLFLGASHIGKVVHCLYTMVLAIFEIYIEKNSGISDTMRTNKDRFLLNSFQSVNSIHVCTCNSSLNFIYIVHRCLLCSFRSNHANSHCWLYFMYKTANVKYPEWTTGAHGQKEPDSG